MPENPSYTTTAPVAGYHKLLDAAVPHLKAIHVFAFHTGMRAGEICGLRRSHINRKANIICLPKELTKEKKAKRIPMNKYVREALQGLPVTVHLDFVFSYMGVLSTTNA